MSHDPGAGATDRDGPSAPLRRVLPWVQRLRAEPGRLRWGRALIEFEAALRADTVDRLADAAGSDRPGGPPLTVRFDLAAAPDGLDRPEGYRLTLREEAGEPVLAVVAAAAAGLNHGARTAAALLAAGRESGLPPLEVDDWPAIAWRGFGEAHYGRAWSVQDRLLVLENAARWGMNAYHYSVGADEYQLLRWADPYPADRLAELAVGARRARELGITASWGVDPSVRARPRLGAHLSSAADAARLAVKLTQVASTGFGRCVLAFDDLTSGLAHEDDRAAFGADPSPLAAAHATFANAVLAALGDIGPELVFCPTLYWGTEDVGGYRKRLGELLDPRIPIWWTGPEVISPTIGAAETRLVARQFGRDRVWIWDNYPVNDWDGTGEMPVDLARPPVLLELGPLRGRAAGVAPAAYGHQASAGNEAAAKIPVITTAALWGWNPDRYDPGVAWDLAVADAFRTSTDPALASAYRRFAELHELSPVAPAAVGWLRPAVHAFLVSPTPGAAASLRDALDEATAVVLTLQRSPHPSAQALTWWLDSLAGAVAAARHAVALVETAHASGGVRRDSSAAFRAEVTAARARGHRMSALMLAAGGALAPLFEQAVAVAGPATPPVDFFAGRSSPGER